MKNQPSPSSRSAPLAPASAERLRIVVAAIGSPVAAVRHPRCPVAVATLLRALGQMEIRAGSRIAIEAWIATVEAVLAAKASPDLARTEPTAVEAGKAA